MRQFVAYVWVASYGECFTLQEVPFLRCLIGRHSKKGHGSFI